MSSGCDGNHLQASGSADDYDRVAKIENTCGPDVSGPRSSASGNYSIDIHDDFLCTTGCDSLTTGELITHDNYANKAGDTSLHGHWSERLGDATPNHRKRQRRRY